MAKSPASPETQTKLKKKIGLKKRDFSIRNEKRYLYKKYYTTTLLQKN